MLIKEGTGITKIIMRRILQVFPGKRLGSICFEYVCFLLPSSQFPLLLLFGRYNVIISHWTLPASLPKMQTKPQKIHCLLHIQSRARLMSLVWQNKSRELHFRGLLNSWCHWNYTDPSTYYTCKHWFRSWHHAIIWTNDGIIYQSIYALIGLNELWCWLLNRENMTKHNECWLCAQWHFQIKPIQNNQPSNL